MILIFLATIVFLMGILGVVLYLWSETDKANRKYIQELQLKVLDEKKKNLDFIIERREMADDFYQKLTNLKEIWERTTLKQ